jgi:hypothetical protein
MPMELAEGDRREDTKGNIWDRGGGISRRGAENRTKRSFMINVPTRYSGDEIMRVRWAKYVAGIWGKRNAHGGLVAKPEANRPFEDLGVDGSLISKIDP